MKIVDDTLLSDSSIEGAFYHTFDFLLQCAKNGIVHNTNKFQFYRDVVQFGGLQITPSGVTPSESMIQAICNFPVLRTITDTRSWFQLVNQVAWANSLSPVMLPFRDLVKLNSKFTWNQSLEDAFKDSKWVIIDLVQNGVAKFDKDRVTCLAPDWSKEGMGFLLLQKHCQCTIEKALSRMLAPDICQQQILYRCWVQICTNRGWGSSNSMGIREMLNVRHGFPKCHSGHRPWTIDEVIWWSWSEQDPKSPAVSPEGKDSKISIYHPALSQEEAERPWHSLPPPSGYGTGPPQCVFSKALSVRFTGFQQHKRYNSKQPWWQCLQAAII